MGSVLSSVGQMIINTLHTKEGIFLILIATSAFICCTSSDNSSSAWPAIVVALGMDTSIKDNL